MMLNLPIEPVDQGGYVWYLAKPPNYDILQLADDEAENAVKENLQHIPVSKEIIEGRA